jgi:UDP-N-acetylbacillosamine N-acetyltransferase
MIAVFGAGGHTRSLLNIIELNNLKIFGIYDEKLTGSSDECINDYKILGGVQDIPAECKVVISKGDNLARGRYFTYFQSQIYKENLIHPTARIEKRVSLKGSNQIFADAYINANVHIGENNILNTKSLIEHEVRIGSHNHISVGAILCGRATIGNYCFVGAGVVIIDKVSVVDNVIIGANAVVTENIVQPGTYLGVPARKIK